MTFNQYTSKVFGTGPNTGFDFDQVFNDIFGVVPSSQNLVKTSAVPGSIHHTVTVPGFGAEDIDVSVEDARLLVVRTKPVKEEKAKTLARISLISGADYTKAKATVKNGLLTVTVPYSAVPMEAFSIDVTAE